MRLWGDNAGVILLPVLGMIGIGRIRFRCRIRIITHCMERQRLNNVIVMVISDLSRLAEFMHFWLGGLKKLGNTTKRMV